MTPLRRRLVGFTWALSTLLTVASAGFLVVDFIRDAQRRAVEARRESELQQAARTSAAAAATLATENEQRTARSLEHEARNQRVGLVLIVAGAGFVATARFGPLAARKSDLPPCKRGDKCQVIKVRRGGGPA